MDKADACIKHNSIFIIIFTIFINFLIKVGGLHVLQNLNFYNHFDIGSGL